MRIAIIALALIASTSAFAAPKITAGGKTLTSCITDAECEAAGSTDKPARDTTTIKACGAQWKTAKADEAVKAAGWPKFWSACAKQAKAAKTVAP